MSNRPAWHDLPEAPLLESRRSYRRMTDESLGLRGQLASLSDKSPPESSLFWKLWRNCESIAQSAYETKFLQQLQGGVLSPDMYGAFTISDLWYCQNGAASYGDVVARTKDPQLKAYITTKRDSYRAFVESFKDEWRVGDTSAICPTEAAKNYAALEERVANEEDPIYTLIVMLPCEILWAWLGDKMKDHVDNNVYGPWIRGNMSFEGAYKLGNFLQQYESKHPGAINHDKALELFTQAMQMEKENFGSP